MRSVSRFHALSEEVARSWSESIGIDRDRITVIPRGVQLDQIGASVLGPGERESARRDLGIDPDAFVFLHVGREEPQKGHRYLLAAWQRVLTEHPEARLVMVGRRGNSSMEVDSALRRLSESVLRLGPRTDVYRLMSMADAFVFPSLYEGIGVSLLESMGAALPVVVFDRPPMNEVITHESTGLCAEPFDSEDLARQMKRLIVDPGQGAKLGAAASAQVARDHDPDVVAARIERVYAQILGMQV
jgi:glycosyltransferase involved in cell wall biosynthesis